MNRSLLFVLVVVPMFIAAAFRIVIHREDTSKTIAQYILIQKQATIRCSPLYIPSEGESIPLLTGWGSYSWKITTSSDSAQLFFNQGINMYYAFHIIEARASFDKATRFDPDCAMAWWGKALAFGPNINDYGYQRPSEAYASAQTAISLANKNTLMEKALISAMAVRYVTDTLIDQAKLNVSYKEEMAKVYKKFKVNPDVGALYADALMLLHPWDLYNHDFSAKPWTPEIVQVLNQTMLQASKHPGAHHYYIHAVEASAHPGDALQSAQLLSNAMPDVAHITHMPSHIYIRTGYYDKGITLNEKALGGYQKYLEAFPSTVENLPLYSLHNLHMKMNCAQMAGNYKLSIDAANETHKQIPPFYLTMEGALGNYAQFLDQSPLFTYIRFGKWEEIIRQTANDSLAYTSVLQHFGRGLAYTRMGLFANAQNELELLEKSLQHPSLKDIFVPFNNAYDAGTIAKYILSGTLAASKKEYVKAIKDLEKAVAAEDQLIYNEPRDWLLPARQYLGDILLKARNYKKAIEVFKKDLAINPNNGWSLTGLALAFDGLHQQKEKLLTLKKRNTAWIIKDIPINRPVF